MSQKLLDDLRQRSDALQNRYEARFAGYSRITRDLGIIDELIVGTKALLDESGPLASDPSAKEVLERLQERHDLYKRERELIVQAKEASPEQRKAIELGGRANRIFQVYRRHFAGQNRRTRDLGILAEMIDDLTEIRDEMDTLMKTFESESLKSDLQVVARNLEMYLTERGEISNARGMENSNDQADLLAELANDQFAIYQKHFAGRGRRTRRPGLLLRILNNLETLRDRMRSLSTSGLTDGTHSENLRVVTQQIDFYKTELASIQRAHADVSVSDRAAALGGEANEIMQNYRDEFAGQNRATRDPAKLVVLIDRIYEIERQMRPLTISNPEIDFNARNLQIVRDNFTLFTREWEAIKEAKAAK